MFEITIEHPTVELSAHGGEVFILQGIQSDDIRSKEIKIEVVNVYKISSDLPSEEEKFIKDSVINRSDNKKRNELEELVKEAFKDE